MRIFSLFCLFILLVIGIFVTIVFARLHTRGPALVSAHSDIPITEVKCPERYPYARCGLISAPLDYQNPAENSIQVAFIYHQPAFPSFGRKKAVQIVHGGPGGAISASLDTWNFTEFRMRLMIGNRALLGIDPRGVGLSTKFDCSILEEKHYAEPGVINTCAEQIGPNRIHISTANTARDFDLVRRSLGLDQLDIYAFSYGTNLSTVYASMYPDAVRTLALDGAYPLVYPDFHPSFYSAMRRQFHQACDRSGECNGDEALNALTWAVKELRNNPRPLDFPNKEETSYLDQYDQLNPSLLASLVLRQPNIDKSRGAASTIWRVPVIGALIKAQKSGDWSDLESIAMRAVSYKTGENLNSSGHSFTVAWAVDCPEMTHPWNDQSSIADRKAELTDAASKLPADSFDPFTVDEWVARPSELNHYGYCIFWPSPPENRPTEVRHRLGETRKDLPVLVINGDYDMATPLEDAILANDQFENSQFARFKNHKHVVLPRSDCAFRLWKEFLKNKRVEDKNMCLDADPLAVSISSK
ncbi:alpha/beta fold hydrolase [Hyphococcus sp. DH-69]|uniref:alpha/beta fold hydrolase n=1 Tax=Hyphococcus formosus TaxID=3143534 RepID=UPI00398A8898